MRTHLAHVRWLLNEVPTWDDSLAPTAVRRVLAEFYGRQETLLCEALAPIRKDDASQALRALIAKSEATRAIEIGVTGAAILVSPAADDASRRGPGPTTELSASSDRSRGADATEASLDVAMGADTTGEARGASFDVQLGAGTTDDARSASFDVPTRAEAPAARRASSDARSGDQLDAVPPAHSADDLHTGGAPSTAAQNRGTPARKPIVLARPPAPPRPSPWVTLIKPVLHESLGWFLGAFLILAGALYLIADAWSGMTSTTRALTVFGLVETWAIGFAVWAAALSRKPTTRAASASLRRIAALVSPLSVLTLGPALGSPFAWLALVAGSLVAAFLTFRAANDLEEPGSMLGASVLLSTVGVGLAPVLPVGSGWAVIVPSLFAAWGFARGPRSNGTWTAVLAWLTPLALVATRFMLMPAQLEFTVAGLVVSTALLAAFALRLAPEGSPERGVVSVVSLTLLAVVFLASFVVPKPACVVVCLLAAWTTREHALGDVAGSRRAWWLSGTYLFSFLAWQRIDQLVPPIVWTWWDALKVSLGYAAAPMPASYGAVYQALFISVGAVLAAVHFARTQSRGAHVWLRSSAVAAGISGLLAMVSLSTDARPALVALPLLALPMLGIGVLARRLDALVAGSGLTALLALVLQQQFMSGLPVMGLALGCAALALALSRGARATQRLNRPARQWLAGTALFASALVTLVAVTQRGTDTFLALCGASVAALVAGRLLHRRVLAAALFTTLAVFVRLESPFLMAAAALLLSLAVLVPRVGRRVVAARALTYALAFLAPAWAFVISVVPGNAPVLPTGLTSLLAAAALFVLARARPGAGLEALRSKPRHLVAWLDGVAIVLLVNAVIPWGSSAGLLPGWSSLHAQLSLSVFALAASVHAVRRGRSPQGVLLAALSSLASVAIAGAHAPDALAWGWPALVTALSTAALLPSLTVPLAALFAAMAAQGEPAMLLVLACASAVLAFAEELDLTWTFALNRARVAWAASLTSAALLVAALALTTHAPESLLVIALCVVLPLMWMRATRQGFVAAAAVPLFAVAGAFAWAPLLAVVLTRALSWNPLRKRLALAELPRTSHVEGVVFIACASLTALVTVVTHPGLEAAWALGLLFMGGGAGVLRVVLAACLAGLKPELRPVTVGALVGVAALAHHAPRALRTMLGARSLAWLELTSLVLAVAGAVLSVLGAASVQPASPVLLVLALGVAVSAGLLATFSRAWVGANRAVRYPSTIVACLAASVAVATLPVTWLVPATLLVAAVLLGAPVLGSLAGLTVGLDLVATLHQGHPVLESTALLVALALAALSVALRSPRVDEVVASWWRKLGREGDWSRASALFWPALTLAAMSLPSLEQASWPALFFPLAVLLVTPRRHEQAATLAVLSVATVWLFPAPVITVAFALAGLTLALLARTVEHTLSSLWRVSAWVLAGAALVAAGADPGAWTVPFAWVCAVVVTWLQVGQSSTGRAWAWGATGVGVHVVMAYVGVRLSTGAPMVLIFPWWAAGSAALALVRFSRGGARSPMAFSVVALVELLCGVVLLHSSQPREAVLSVLVAGALAFIAWRRVVERDDAAAAWLGQLAVVAGALAARVLGAGAMPGLTEAWVLLGASAVFAGLSQFLKREGRAGAGGALAVGAWAWPAVGALLVPWTQWTAASLWLVGVSLLGAWLSRTSARRTGTLVSAGAINAALVLAAVGTGWSEWHLLLVPLGLTLMVLSWLFRGDVSARSQILLRAWGMGFVYAAMAWKPLTVNSVGALVACVVVCLLGVALGALWRIRSYVLLGSGVVVTTVLATLVRSGLAEPRLGAVFLSLLGLVVVVVMVMITTRRDELRERMAAMQRVMATWSP